MKPIGYLLVSGAAWVLCCQALVAVPLRPLDRAGIPLEIRRFPLRGAVHAIHWSNQPKQVFLVGDVVHLFDLGKGETVRLFNDKAPPTQVGMALHPQGKTLYTARVGAGVLAWEIATGRQQPLPTARVGAIHLAVSPDGKILVFQREDGNLSLWDLEGNKEQATLTPVTNKRRPPLITLAISGDSRRLFTGHRSGAFLWNLEEPGLLGTQSNYECYGSDWHPAHAMVAAVPWSLLVYDDQLKTTKQFGNKYSSMKFTPDGKHLVGCAATVDQSLEVQRWPEGQVVQRYPGKHVAFGLAPDGRSLVSMGQGEVLHWWVLPE